MLKNIFAVILCAVISSACASTQSGIYYKHQTTVGDPSVAVVVDNKLTITNVNLVNFGDVHVLYSPFNQQVYLQNLSESQTYYIEYTYFGNTAVLGSIPYTSIPSGSSEMPITLNPGQIYYLNETGELDTNYNIDTINTKFILQDLTILNINDQIIALGCDMNNQHIYSTFNRILMSCVQTTMPNKTGRAL